MNIFPLHLHWFFLDQVSWNLVFRFLLSWQDNITKVCASFERFSNVQAVFRNCILFFLIFAHLFIPSNRDFRILIWIDLYSKTNYNWFKASGVFYLHDDVISLWRLARMFFFLSYKCVYYFYQFTIYSTIDSITTVSLYPQTEDYRICWLSVLCALNSCQF